MSASFDGSATASAVARTKRSAFGVGSPATSGVQCVAGESVGSSVIVRGPVRRSNSAASDVRQLFAIMSRCAGVIVTCISFSASANVAGVTAGPTGGAVLNAGGAPAVAGVGAAVPDCVLEPLHAASVAARPSGASRRKVRRVVTSAGVKDDGGQLFYQPGASCTAAESPRIDVSFWTPLRTRPT